jgi:hypothetical protein
MNTPEAVTFLQSCMGDFQACSSNAMRILDPVAQEAAFGPRGLPGDPVRIEHLGQRFVTVYEDFLDTAARIRGSRVPNELRNLCDLTADIATTPVREIRQFIDDFTSSLETTIVRLLESVPSDQSAVIDMTLLLTFDEELTAKVNQECQRLEHRLTRKR